MKLDDSETTRNSVPLTFSCYLGLFGLIALVAALAVLGALFLPQCFLQSLKALDQVVAPYGY